jgi:Ca-activated chloride channel family protein
MIGVQDISAFYFEWPWALALLLLIPVGWALYMRQLRRRLHQIALHFSYTAVVEQIRQQPPLWKRLLLPGACSLLSACLVIALARPTVVGRVPVNSVDMMIVMDISLSMLAEDIRPDRITAAKEAAIHFVESLPRDVRVGLEVFAGDNYVLSPPTSRHNEVEAYLRALRREDLKPRTEIGSALHSALKLLETKPAKPQSTSESSDAKTEQSQTEKQNPNQRPDKVIILLSDGDSHEGYPWDQAARDALKQNVIIHSIGIGSPQGGVIQYQGLELPVNFDETTLKRIAEMAQGQYFRVFKEADFHKVYEQIHARTVHYEERDVDLAYLMAGGGLLVMLAALLLLLLI